MRSAKPLTLPLLGLVLIFSVVEAPPNPTDDNRIIGGTPANAFDYPFMVFFGRCGGSLVAPDVVVSVRDIAWLLSSSYIFFLTSSHDPDVSQAAHCADSDGSRIEAVLVGAVDQTDFSAGDAELRFVQSEQMLHPRYDAEGDNRFDIMVFKIQAVTKLHLEPIELNLDDNYPSDGQLLRVIGFGLTSDPSSDPNATVSDELLYADVIQENADSCAADYEDEAIPICESLSGRPCDYLTVFPSLMLCGNYLGKEPKDR